MRKNAASASRGLGERLKAVRLAYGISERDLSRKLGISSEQLRALERGERRAGPREFLVLIQILGMAWVSEDKARAAIETSMSDAVLRELDILALHKLHKLRDPAVKRDVIRLIGTLVDAAESHGGLGQSGGVFGRRIP